MIDQTETMYKLIELIDEAKIKPKSITMHYSLSNMIEMKTNMDWEIRKQMDYEQERKDIDDLRSGKIVFRFTNCGDTIIEGKRCPNEEKEWIESAIKKKEAEIEELNKSLELCEED